jgi:hypothetical protein
LTSAGSAVRGGELLGDLEAAVAAADDEHGSSGDGGGGAVGAAVQLLELGIEAVGERRHEGHLKRPGGETT